MSANAEDDLVALAHAWDRAMGGNDAEAIGRYMADDWTIIGSDGSVGDKASFLALVAAGDLSHDVMTSEDVRVRLYGDATVVPARGVSGGQYQGWRFLEVERSSSIFIRRGGEWRCVLTHLSRLVE